MTADVQPPPPADTAAPGLPDEVVGRLGDLVDQLRSAFVDAAGGPPPPPLVTQVVRGVADAYADARVHEFTLVLIERGSREALRQRGFVARALHHAG